MICIEHDVKDSCIWNHMREKKRVTCFLFSDLLIITNEYDSELNLTVLAKYELCRNLISYSF